MNKDLEHQEAHVVVASADVGAVDLLHDDTGISKQRIKAAMNQGAAWITRGSQSQRIRRAKRTLQVGDELHLYYDAKILAEVPPKPTLLADVGGYSVWRKPFGMRSQGSKWGDHCTLVRWTETHLEGERTGFTVHRLDMAANGVMLVAHTKAMAAALGKLFMERQIEKRYRAVVIGDFSNKPNPLSITAAINEKTAYSEVSFLQLSADEQRSLVDVRIETGRKHQIRQHLAGIGHPVLGDRLYGTGESDGVDLQLTAYMLAFQCPVSDEPVEYQLGEQWLPHFI
jgi:tRNA pseudouridine32 synthase/23S rRNA pseudouridine746 synthase